MLVQFAFCHFHFIKPAVVNWAMDTREGIVLWVGGVPARLETRQAVHLMGNSSARLAVAGAPAGNGNLMLHLHLILARCERANPTYAFQYHCLIGKSARNKIRINFDRHVINLSYNN